MAVVTVCIGDTLYTLMFTLAWVFFVLGIIRKEKITWFLLSAVISWIMFTAFVSAPVYVYYVNETTMEAKLADVVYNYYPPFNYLFLMPLIFSILGLFWTLLQYLL